MWSAGSQGDLERALADFEILLRSLTSRLRWPTFATSSALPSPLPHGSRVCACGLWGRIPVILGGYSAAAGARLAGRCPVCGPPPRPGVGLGHRDQVRGSCRGCVARRLALQQDGNRDAHFNPPVAAFEEALGLMPGSSGGRRATGLARHGVRPPGRGGATARPRPVGESLMERPASWATSIPGVAAAEHARGRVGFRLGGREPSREESTAAIDLLESVIEGYRTTIQPGPSTLVRLGALLITRA